MGTPRRTSARISVPNDDVPCSGFALEDDGDVLIRSSAIPRIGRSTTRLMRPRFATAVFGTRLWHDVRRCGEVPSSTEGGARGTLPLFVHRRVSHFGGNGLGIVGDAPPPRLPRQTIFECRYPIEPLVNHDFLIKATSRCRTISPHGNGERLADRNAIRTTAMKTSR